MQKRALDLSLYEELNARLTAHQAAIFMLTMALRRDQKDAAANALTDLGKQLPRRTSRQFRRAYQRQLQEFVGVLRSEESNDAQGT